MVFGEESTLAYGHSSASNERNNRKKCTKICLKSKPCEKMGKCDRSVCRIAQLPTLLNELPLAAVYKTIPTNGNTVYGTSLVFIIDKCV
jgi:hypothetical protein